MTLKAAKQDREDLSEMRPAAPVCICTIKTCSCQAWCMLDYIVPVLPAAGMQPDAISSGDVFVITIL